MANTQINLTIIIPTYNSSLYIKKTLSHLVDQDYKDFLVLIVDDNSSDDTIKIISSFKKKLNLKLENKPKNVKPGAAASINYAFSLLETKYWALVDSDAFLNKNWTRVTSSALREKMIVGAPIYAYKPNEVIAYLSGLEIESRYKYLKPGFLHHLSTCNIAGRRELIKYIDLNEDLKYAYDHELSFQLKRNGILFYLTKETYCHHLNKNGLIGYTIQQYRIAKYHLMLSKRMKDEAKAGDEISPNSLLLQPIFMTLGIALLFFSLPLGIISLFIVIALNSKFIVYSSRRNLFYLPLIILMILIKNIAWIAGAGTGLFERI